MLTHEIQLPAWDNPRRVSGIELFSIGAVLKRNIELWLSPMANSSGANVSVIIPIFNAEKHLAQTIQCVLDQTYADFELLLIDDGSTDTSAQICSSFSDPRIRYFRQENAGVSAARNLGLENTYGEFIGFLDSDDLWHPEKIAHHVVHFEKNPKIGVSYSGCHFINAQGGRLNTSFMPKITNVSAADVYCRNPISGGSSAFFRREIFDEIVEPKSGDGATEYFDLRASAPGVSLAEDHQCWLRMALKSRYKFEGISKHLTYYRIHDAGLSANVGKMHQGWIAIDKYVSEVAPKLHKSHSALANAYQMRYFARRLVAQGNAPEALKFMGKSVTHSLLPFWLEPIKSFSTLSAAILLLIAPNLMSRLVRNEPVTQENL